VILRKHVLTFIAACFYYIGLVRLVRHWRQRSGEHLVILNYHRATGGALDLHLSYLRRHYRILDIETALEELYARPSEERQVHDRRTPLVISFDDGYQDNYTYAFALACKLQIPIAIFVIPGYIESGDCFWWLKCKYIVNHAQVSEVAIQGRTYHLNRPKERKALTQVIGDHLDHATAVAEREALLASFLQLLAVPSSSIPEEKAALPLTWTQVREMDESGYVSFGAHTMHHPILANLSDPDQVQSEVGDCRVVLEQQLGHAVRAFAYPVGQLQHIGDNAVRAVQQAGYAWALTTLYGLNTPLTDPYLLRRIEVDVSQHWLVLAAQVAGLWGVISRLRWIPIIRKHFTNTWSK
jgi:peptidoglycan/xylan/chitin deacetylase (PgdA/CDA1 family)